MNTNDKPAADKPRSVRKSANEGRRFNTYGATFKGETPDMNGKVFQLLIEQQKKDSLKKH